MPLATFPAPVQERRTFGQALRARRLQGDGLRPHKVEWCCSVIGFTRKAWYNWESGAMLPSLEAYRAIQRLYPDLGV